MSLRAEPPAGAVAVVVQRWHPKIAGGSEHLAFQFASLLKERYPVELLTTTATDPGTWANEIEPGTTEIDGLTLRRFSVSRGREPYWFKLHELLVRYDQARQSEPVRTGPETYFGTERRAGAGEIPWPIALQEEWLRRQGPHSRPLLDWLATRGDRYRAILYVTYLYSPAYFGSLLTDPARSFLVSTLHDEPPARLSLFRHMAGRFRAHFWLTAAERDLSHRLWGERPGRIIPAYVEPIGRANPAEREATATDTGAPYLLYCGRIDPGKGVPVLLDFFARFKQAFQGPLDLVLTGDQAMKLPRRSDVRKPGFVSENRKQELLAGATVFVMPSPLESLSIVTLEAMAAGTPVLVNGENPVLREHIRKGDGRAFFDYASFAAELSALLDDPGLRDAVGRRARAYVNENFSRERVARDLFAEIEKVPAV